MSRGHQNDIDGLRAGKLLVLRRVNPGQKGAARWQCQCDCGAMIVTTGSLLATGSKTSCGCVPAPRRAERVKVGRPPKADARSEPPVAGVPPPKQFRLKTRLYNNRLLRLREDLGETIRGMAQRIRVDPGSLWKLETLRTSPRDADGDWRPVARKIAEFHGVDPAWVFGDGVEQATGATVQVALSAAEVRGIGGSRPDVEITSGEFQHALEGALSGLSAQERAVIEARFGLVTREERTRVEVGEALGVSRERVRQIEYRALRRLRHPSRASGLKTWVDDDGGRPFEVAP